jgi:hypothetical protein
MLGGFMTWAAWVGPARAGGPPPVYDPPMDQYTRAARQVMSAMFVDQAGNGRVFDQTLWNYHFEEGSDELHPSGQAVLDRLVQQWPANPVDIYVQVAHDLPYHPRAPGLYPTEREALTARRVQAVVNYLAATRPDVPYAIHLHDLPPRAISGVEAVIAVRGMQQQVPQGFLPIDVLGRVVITPRSLLYGTSRSSSLGLQTTITTGTSSSTPSGTGSSSSQTATTP